MYCGNCNREIGEWDNYCKFCGKLVHAGRQYVQRWKNNGQMGPHQVQINQDFEHLKDFLLCKYRGKRIEEIFGGREINTDRGSCYLIENSQALSLTRPDKNKAIESLLSDLKLLYGIGEITEQKLKSQGYTDISKLTCHPRYRKEAKRFINCLRNVDQHELMGWVCRWFPKSHRHTFCLSSFNRESDFLVLDIETLGLSNKPIILIGLAQIKKGMISIKQYLARNFDEEPALLLCLKDNIANKSVFITFNGAMFDIPFIKQRFYYYRLQPDLERVNFDVLHFSRKMYKDKFSSFKLTSLEKNLLQIKRKQDIPGFMVPDFYTHYINEKNIGPLVPLVRHNRQDLISLACIFSRLGREWKKF
ncbi:MAG: ribonuclease H-like domain-containing protein [Actinomycetota bacterium]